MNSKRKIELVATFVVCLLVAVNATPQDIYYSTLVGTVRDASGAVVPRVEVTANEVATGVKSTSRTNAAGDYRIATLRPGRYTVAATASGFKEAVVTDVILLVAKEQRVDMALQVGSVAQTVQVKGSAPLLQTDSAERGSVMERRDVEEIPLDGRNIIELTSLTPGAAPSSNYGVTEPAVNGMAAYSNLFLVDGGGATSLYYSMPVEHLNIDLIEEFKIETSNYSADRGVKAGGIVSIATKHGTNQLHGTLFEFLRNTSLDARNWFAASTPPLVYNDFGSEVGGPIRKDKVFFQFSYEGSRSRRSNVYRSYVPTMAERVGNFNPGTGQKDTDQVFNPFNLDPNTGLRLPFDNNTIPQTMMNKIALEYLALIPNPTTLGGFPNFQYVASSSEDLNTTAGRVDFNLSQKDRLYVRYSYQTDPFFTPGSIPNAYAGQQGANVKGSNTVVSWTRTIGPRTLNEARFSFQDEEQIDNQEGASLNLYQKLGYADASTLPTGIGGCPYVTIQDISMSQPCSYPYINDYPSHNYFISDDFSFVRKAHSFKAGVLNTRYQVNTLFALTGGAYSYFDGRYTTQINGPPSGQPFADFLLGTPYRIRSDYSPELNNDRKNLWHMYFMDDWKASSSLTLQLGFRYELNLPYYEANGRSASWYDGLGSRTGQTLVFPHNAQAPLTAALNGSPLGFPDRFTDNNWTDLPNWHDVGPRIGVAWRPFGSKKWVIRGGYGIFYNLPEGTLENSKGYGQPFFSSGSTPTSNNFYESPPYILGQVPPVSAAFAPGPLSSGYVSFPRMPDGRHQQWNVTFQRQLSENIGVEASYVGNFNGQTTYFSAWNMAEPVGYTFHYADGTSYTIQPSDNVNVRTKYPELAAGNGGINTYIRGTYHGAQFQLTKRMSHGLDFRVGYTRSRSQGVDLYQFEDEWTIPQQPDHIRHDDRPNLFFATYVYQLPGQSLRGVEGKILGGWQLSGVIETSSGPVYDVWDDYFHSYLGNAYFFGKQVGNPVLPKSQRTMQAYFNINAFAYPGDNQFGDAFGDVRGPGSRTFNTALCKYFTVREGQRLQFRAEFFNVLNHPIFSLPGTIEQGVPSTAELVSASNGREIQLALKYQF